MKNLLPKIIFLYCGVAAILITIATALTATNIVTIIFIILFIPVSSYFLISAFNSDPEINLMPRKSEIIIIVIIFAVLLGIGFKNLTGSDKRSLSGLPDKLIFNVSPTPT